MTAAVFDISIKQGATLRTGFVYKNRLKKPYDLTGVRAHMQIRDAGGSLIAELTSENGGIAIGGDTGTIDLLISDEDTEAMNFVSALYDLFLIYPNGDRDCLVTGKVTFSKSQTRHE